MNERSTILGAGAALALALSACGGAVQSGVAVGRAGRGLGAEARTVPQAAEVCALGEALSVPPGNEKPVSEACGKAARSDQVWRRSMVVLAAYAQTLETLASGSGADNAGKLEAALTGADAPGDGPAEQAAHDASAALVQQMANGAGGDLSRAIRDAAPNVKTLCDGLTAYLDATAKGFADLQKDAEKKRASHQDRRCGTVSGTNFCVGESPIDRMVYGHVFAEAALLEGAHLATRGRVAAFCAAHQRAEQAAQSGDLGKDKTYADIVDAVRSSQSAPAAPAAPAKPAKK